MEAGLLFILAVASTILSGCTGLNDYTDDESSQQDTPIDNSNHDESIEMHWIEISVIYSLEHNDSIRPVQANGSHRADWCTDGYREGNLGFFQRDVINEFSNVAIITTYPDFASDHQNTHTETLQNISLNASWRTPLIGDEVNFSLGEGNMTFGNQTFDVNENYTLNRTTMRPGKYDSDGDGYYDKTVEDSVTLHEYITFAYRGVIQTKAIGSYPCD